MVGAGGQKRHKFRNGCMPTDQCLHAQLRLMGHESLIMQQSDIGAIADSVKDCLRCGKCPCAPPMCRAPTCCIQPAQQDSGHLAAGRGLLVRGADAPRRQPSSTGRSSRTWPTTAPCAKVPTPCPVKIDFGDVTMNMRNLLRKMGKKLASRQQAGHGHAQRHQPRHHQAAACGMVGGASRPSAWRWTMLRGISRRQTQRPPASVGPAPVKEQVIHFINKKPRWPAQEDRTRAARHREQGLRPHHPQPGRHHGRHRGRVLLPRLRL